MTPILSALSRRWKLDFFFSRIPKDARILEVGCGSGWLLAELKTRGFTNARGIDLAPPADVVGDIRDWRRLGLEPESFDAVVAFEVVEHVDCLAACRALLKPGGRLLATTPVPERDGLCLFLERLGLSQKRTSPHDHLMDLRRAGGFRLERYSRPAGLAQWAILAKDAASNAALPA